MKWFNINLHPTHTANKQLTYNYQQLVSSDCNSNFFQYHGDNKLNYIFFFFKQANKKNLLTVPYQTCDAFEDNKLGKTQRFEITSDMPCWAQMLLLSTWASSLLHLNMSFIFNVFYIWLSNQNNKKTQHGPKDMRWC